MMYSAISFRALLPVVASQLEFCCVCVSFFAWRTVMPVPGHGRSASLDKE